MLVVSSHKVFRPIILYAFLTPSPILVSTLTIYPLHLTNTMIFVDEYKLLCHLLCSFLQPNVTSPLLRPIIGKLLIHILKMKFPDFADVL
jgi:hypothetical protein